MAHEQRTGLQRAGRALQAFGGGQGFLQREREQHQQLDESRKLAMLQDNRDLLGLLKNKQIPRARQLLTDRLGDLRTLGSVDTSDTEEMLGFLDTDPAKALSESQFLDDMAITRQLLPAAAAESFTLSPGQTRFQGGQEVASVAAAAPKPTQRERDIELFLPDGVTFGSATRSQKQQAFKQSKETATASQTEADRLKVLSAQVRLDRDRLALETDETKRVAKARELEQNEKDLAFNALNSVQTVDQTVATIDRLLEGTKLESAAGFQSTFPTIGGTEAAEFETVLETLKSQLFLAGVEQLKGLGALSEAEGRKISDAVGSLSISLPDQTLRSELNRIKVSLGSAKQQLQAKFGDRLPQQAQPNVGRFQVRVLP